MGPPEYKVIFDALRGDHEERQGPFVYHTGTISGIPVVVSIAPQDGPLMRSLAAQKMLQHYDIKAFIYPGTSGAHLGPDQMRLGDVVLGAANVDFGNFFMARDGSVIGNEFGHEKTGRLRYSALYLDPKLLMPLACSARRVAEKTELPAWMNPGFSRPKPDIFYYGIQGTSTMWLANKEFMAKLDASSHAMDEDGDFYSNVVATLYHIPFIEVSTIADSILELPETERGSPVPPAGSSEKASVVAQRVSNHIAIDFIAHSGAMVLAGGFATPVDYPYPAKVFETPKVMAGLDGCG